MTQFGDAGFEGVAIDEHFVGRFKVAGLDNLPRAGQILYRL